MADLTLFGDARAEVITVLNDLLVGRAEAYAVGVEVSGRLPNPDAPAPTPYLYVTSDGVPDSAWPVVQHTTIRCTAWHLTEPDAVALAQLALALLLANTGTTDQLAGCHWLTGPIPALDPDSGQPMAYFTVRASMQGRNVPA